VVATAFVLLMLEWAWRVIADRLIDLAFVAAFLMERTPP
jgi:hypothetical protein